MQVNSYFQYKDLKNFLNVVGSKWIQQLLTDKVYVLN